MKAVKSLEFRVESRRPEAGATGALPRAPFTEIVKVAAP